MKNRLSKIIAGAGVASRRAAEELIFEGRVKVNGAIVIVPQTLVDSKKDHITVDGKRVKDVEQKVYYLLNKPPGYLCTNARPHPTSKLVLDLFAHLPFRLFTVGRLDRDTTGLLFVTNDGHFANSLIHPSFGVTKEYLVKVEEEVSPEHLAVLAHGAYVEGVKVTPLSVKKMRRGTLKIVVGEGKKREVRLLIEHAELTIKELSRIRIGSWTLGKIPLGGWKELSAHDIEAKCAEIKKGK